ncbi:type II secretion system protein [Clostridium estertheticum]|uniref:type II secretion system protein n=1 Tax=Clostridium estertheticum TaxID=238834 RepID=UPI001C7CEE51|nr:prepilin-type N-terminal cleavage/methylation domain-containing protein [Clostridium estertheticum]MBX4265246.1 prepilin-type N-terminal cleavage/methylation domain-containing protein [Clostridium estertheticum]WLC90392.1 prepilin-type N-terminal cleavage/methylation domain-containing protein [Clostridium estertheticum]
MSKSLSKKGFTLVEVLCSLGVFSIIFICMMSFDKASINMRKDIKNINNEVLIMEAIKNNIINSMTFKELQQLETSKNFFVNKENMNFDKIKTNVVQVFSDHTSTQNPYIELSLIKDELNVYKLNLLLHSGKTNKKEELQCNFYKGCHE